jgi:hypothetical protein
VPEAQVPGDPRHAALRLGLGVLGPGRADQALAAGLLVQVGDPGLDQSVADAVGGVHLGLLDAFFLHFEDAPKAGRRGSGDFLISQARQTLDADGPELRRG